MGVTHKDITDKQLLLELAVNCPKEQALNRTPLTVGEIADLMVEYSIISPQQRRSASTMDIYNADQIQQLDCLMRLKWAKTMFRVWRNDKDFIR